MCKAAIPEKLTSFMNATEDAAEQFQIGVEHARAQTLDLMSNQVPGIHYYVLNKSDAAAALLDGMQTTQSA